MEPLETIKTGPLHFQFYFLGDFKVHRVNIIKQVNTLITIWGKITKIPNRIFGQISQVSYFCNSHLKKLILVKSKRSYSTLVLNMPRILINS